MMFLRRIQPLHVALVFVGLCIAGGVVSAGFAAVTQYQGSLTVPTGGSIQDLNQIEGCAEYSSAGVLTSNGNSSGCLSSSQIQVCATPGTNITITPPWPCTISASSSSGIWSLENQVPGDTASSPPYVMASNNTPQPIIYLPESGGKNFSITDAGEPTSKPGVIGILGNIALLDPAVNELVGSYCGEEQGALPATGAGLMCTTHGYCAGVSFGGGAARCIQAIDGGFEDIFLYWEFDAPIANTQWTQNSAVCTSDDTVPELVTGTDCPFNGAQPTYGFTGQQIPAAHWDTGEVAVAISSGATSGTQEQSLTGSSEYSSNSYDCLTTSNSNTTGALISNILVKDLTSTSFTVQVVLTGAAVSTGTVEVFVGCNGE